MVVKCVYLSNEHELKQQTNSVRSDKLASRYDERMSINSGTSQ